MKKNVYLLLTALILTGSLLRFYNLNWGSPYYFHPDERNIASAVSSLEFPQQMNPHFFAYGSLPIYTIYFTGVAINFFSTLISQLLPSDTRLPGIDLTLFTISFESAILISRFYSALFSTLLIPILFIIAKKISQPRRILGEPKAGDLSDLTGLTTAFLATFSTGFIQFAHFGTFEMWLTFFTVLMFWITIKLISRPNYLFIFLLSIVFGILISVKVSHLALFPIPILLFLYIAKPRVKSIFKRSNFLILLNVLKQTLYFLTVSGTIYLLTNPFVILDEKSFFASMKYESEVALGSLPVFYTGEFVNTIPVLFQFQNIYPFLINPILTVVFIPAFFYLTYIAIKTKNPAYILLNTFYIALFVSQAFLYVKWTRYMIPTLPFIYLICSITLTYMLKLKSKNLTALNYPLFIILLFASIIFSVSFFLTVYTREDTRLSAKNFTIQYIPSESRIISEVFDLGIVPFNDSFPNIKLYNFYDLDNNSYEFTTQTLEQELSTADYIILPSQRISKPRLENPHHYPLGHKFYSDLFNSQNGFQKIYETPCDLFCRITYLNNPVFSFEQTANVFDRPPVFIFMKKK